MATCKECLHFEVCDSGRHIGEHIEDDGVYSDRVEKECQAFKYAADVVEVVRCKDCNKAKRIDNLGNYRCFIYQNTFGGNHYCCYGERRDTE